MRTASPPPSGDERRQYYRVDTWVRLAVAAAEDGAEGGAPVPVASDLLNAHHVLTDSLRDLRLDLEPGDRLVVDKFSRFCTAITAAVEQLAAQARGEAVAALQQVDLSGGGMGFISDAPWPVGARLALAVQLVEVASPGSMRLAAQVTYCRSLGNGRRCRLGVKFVDLEEDVRQRLIATLFDIQRLRLRGGP